MHLEESQFVLFDLQQSVEETAESLYAAAGESGHFNRFAVLCR